MPRLTQPALPALPGARLGRARPSLLANAVQAIAVLAIPVLALGLPGAAQAQSLLTLYDAARGYDAAYQSARAQAESLVFRAEQSRAAKRPSVDGTATWAESRSESPLAASTNVSRSSQQSVGLTARYAIFNRSNDKTIAKAEKAIEVARTQLGAVEQDLIVRLVQAYFDVLAASDALATVQTSKTAIAEQLASAKRNFEVGTATITDTREAQAKFDLGTAQELAAENDLNVKRLALDGVVGRAGIIPKRMAVPVVLPPTVPADVEQWVSQADAASPGLEQLRLARELARLDTDLARTGNLPTVGVSASVTEAHTRLAGTSIATGPWGGFGLSGSVAVQLTMPLYTGDLVQNRIKETLALEDKAQSDLEAGRRSVAQATRSAFFGVRSLHAQVTALEAAESSSKLALEATQLGYKVGVRVNLDVLNAQTQLYQAQRDLARARYDVVVNSLKLRQVSGQLQPQDVNAVDALLAR